MPQQYREDGKRPLLGEQQRVEAAALRDSTSIAYRMEDAPTAHAPMAQRHSDQLWHDQKLYYFASLLSSQQLTARSKLLHQRSENMMQ